jgi:Ser/Thr protein kinase RdoA (MazF antagonist)
LHGDYGRGNLIFEGENIAGAVDWDQACWGHPLFDVARFASYLLIDTPLSLRTVGELVTSAYPGWNKLKVDLPDLKKGIEYCWLTDLIRWAQQRHTPNFQKLQMCLIRQGYLNYGKN